MTALPQIAAVHSASQSYAGLALSMAPRGFWPLDEASGTNARDLSGNGYDGTYVATPTLHGRVPRPPQQLGDARRANFNGSTQYVDLNGQVGNFSSLAACTVVLQFTTESAPGFDEVFSLSDSSQLTDNWSIIANGTGDLAVLIRDGGSKVFVETAANIDTTGAVNNFAAFAGDGSGNEFWFNGTRETTYVAGNASTAAGFDQVANLDSMRIAIRLRSSGNFGPWDGSVWNVAVFPSRLTASQLNALYLASLHGT